MRDILLVLFFFAAVYFAFRRPYLGVSAWVWIALTAPAYWAFGFSQSFRLNLSIVLVTFLSYIFVQKNKKLNFSSLFFWVGLFGFWALLSTLFTSTSDSAKVMGYYVDFVKVLMLFFFIVLIVQKRLHIDTLVWAVVLSVSSYAAMEAVKFVLSGGGHRIVGRAGVIADRNDLAVAINMCIPLVVYLYQTSRLKLVRLGLLGLILLNIAAIVGTYSRGGFIGLVMLGFFFWLRSNRKLVIMLLFLMALPVGYSFAPSEWKERQTTVSSAATEDGSFIGRLWAWKISTLIAIDHPVVGGGFRAVTDPLLWNMHAPYTPYFSPLYTPPVPTDLVPKAAHNIYFQVLGDHGFFGLCIFLIILLQTIRLNGRNAKFAKQHNIDWMQKLSHSLFLSVVGYCVTGANVSLAYFDLLYTMIGIVAVIHVHKQQMLDNENKQYVPVL